GGETNDIEPRLARLSFVRLLRRGGYRQLQSSADHRPVGARGDALSRGCKRAIDLAKFNLRHDDEHPTILCGWVDRERLAHRLHSVAPSPSLALRLSRQRPQTRILRESGDGACCDVGGGSGLTVGGGGGDRAGRIVRVPACPF